MKYMCIHTRKRSLNFVMFFNIFLLKKSYLLGKVQQPQQEEERDRKREFLQLLCHSPGSYNSQV